MHRRCRSPNFPGYADYGGRGIRVCVEWTGRGGFARFLDHLGRKPSPKHSLDRIDVNGHYQPGNVRWADWTTQLRNTRKNVFVEWQGRRVCISEVAHEVGIDATTLFSRLRRGMPIDVAASTPVDKRFARKGRVA